MEFSAEISRISDRLRISDSVLFITGAGLSVDSGLPTYRGIGGLYNADDTEEGLPIEEVLSGEMLRSEPDVTWKYLSQVSQACRRATFNRGHQLIAQFEYSLPRVWVLTQNVDGFHRAAGSTNVLDIHGDMHDLCCTECTWQDWIDDFGELDIPPECPDCGGLVRPQVVLFGEMLPFDKVDRLHAELSEGFDIIFAIGTSALFPYISEPVYAVVESDTLTVEINPDVTELTDVVDIALPMRAVESLERIWDQSGLDVT
ncbi:MAG: NAD-dependent protein deacylase [Fuerstiella sp.]|nr:NAD-dependent protein deacylase [Fuerstiella sp.]